MIFFFLSLSELRVLRELRGESEFSTRVLLAIDSLDDY